MRRQSSIESYFKAKGSIPKSSQTLGCKDMSDMKVKRRNLSLIKSRTPGKSPKQCEDNKAVDGVINLCSDDEDVFEISNSRTSTVNLSQGSTSSNDTLKYSVSPETPKKTLQNSQTSQESHQVLRTPLKTPQSSSTSQSSQGTKLKSTSSPKKFFSPTKNRTVVKRSPSKVKRSLRMEMAILAGLAEDEIFTNACKGMDDKSE